MSNVVSIDAQILFQPDASELRFLPEGPQWCGNNRLSWVAIQHGASAAIGSLNLLDMRSGENIVVPLRGRPGFAFPTADPDTFVVGMEHELSLVHLTSGMYRPMGPVLEQGVSGTIINDGEFFEEGIVFGAKDLQFAEAKAGLYLYRRADAETIQLADNCVCSNGKVLFPEGPGAYRLLDIDSPRKRVDEYRLNVALGTLQHVGVALDFSDGTVFPDGMVATPDGSGVIIAFYNPNDADYGEARQYDLSTRRVTTIWRTPGSPQVTCPQLVEMDGRIRLVLTTAVEHMNLERQRRYPLAGCLFIADTPFTDSLAHRLCRV